LRNAGRDKDFIATGSVAADFTGALVAIFDRLQSA
jgi:hypothetical protein